MKEFSLKYSPRANAMKEKRQRRKVIRRLKYIWVSCFLLIVSGILMVFSWLFRCCAWISSALLSVSAGVLTGFVLYLLTNLRGNKIHRIQCELDALKPLCDSLENATKTIFYRESQQLNTTCSRDVFELFRSAMQDVEYSRNALPERVEHELGYDDFDPLNKDLISKYVDQFQGSEDDSALAEIRNELCLIKKQISELIAEKEIQLSFLFSVMI